MKKNKKHKINYNNSYTDCYASMLSKCNKEIISISIFMQVCDAQTKFSYLILMQKALVYSFRHFHILPLIWLFSVSLVLLTNKAVDTDHFYLSLCKQHGRWKMWSKLWSWQKRYLFVHRVIIGRKINEGVINRT